MASSRTINKWTLDELDLNKELTSLESLVGNKQTLVETLFSILTRKEIKELVPNNLKEMPLDILKDLCILDLDNDLLTNEEILQILGKHSKESKIMAEKLVETCIETEQHVQVHEDQVDIQVDPRERERKELLNKMDQQMKVMYIVFCRFICLHL